MFGSWCRHDREGTRQEVSVNRAAALIVVAVGVLASVAVRAEPTEPATPAPTMASVMEAQLNIVESLVVPAAEAMPEARYVFAPETGMYKGVRTFAQQVKHVATANLVFYSAILGQAPPAGVTLAGATNG